MTDEDRISAVNSAWRRILGADPASAATKHARDMGEKEWKGSEGDGGVLNGRAAKYIKARASCAWRPSHLALPLTSRFLLLLRQNHWNINPTTGGIIMTDGARFNPTEKKADLLLELNNQAD